MHQYLSAIGFGNIQTKKLEKGLLEMVVAGASYNKSVSLVHDNYGEMRRKFGENIGVTVCGAFNDEDRLELEYYFPFLQSLTVSSYADIIVDKRKDTESYMGICEDMRIGTNLIFYLQNPTEYMVALQDGTLSKKGTSVSLAGLAISGTVLFPVMKTPVMIKNSKEESRKRIKLISAARKGDSSAVDSLALEDMEVYTKISRRILAEDIFSIVDTYFMPYGVECDEYSIMGEIKELRIMENQLSNQQLYHMILEINEMYMELCVPVEGVLGEPEVGRRFKAIIWLQGRINFPR